MSIIEKIQNLINKSNEITGSTDADLTTAVKSLIDGYGSGGGVWEVPDGTKFAGSTFTEFTNISILNCTKLDSMFDGCGRLAILDELDMSNVTSANSCFRYCYALSSDAIKIKNSTKLQNMQAMFYTCNNANFTYIPEFDTSKCTNFNGTFTYCANLTSIYEGFDISATTNLYQAWRYCSKLVDVPVMSAPNCTGASNMFGNCGLLSNDSLNNIMALCISMTKTSAANKTLKFIGLTSDQAAICQTLSNYSAFTSAGWTTGY